MNGRFPEATDAVPHYCRATTLVVGCGNLLLGDDGFGCAAVQYLEAHGGTPDDVCLLDVGTGVRKVLFTLCLSSIRPRRLLVLDAMDLGRPPGDLFEVDLGEIPVEKLDDFSMHQIPTSNLLRDLRDGCGMEVRVLACQTGRIPDVVRPGLSPALLRALPEAARWIREEYFPPGPPPARAERKPCKSAA